MKSGVSDVARTLSSLPELAPHIMQVLSELLQDTTRSPPGNTRTRSKATRPRNDWRAAPEVVFQMMAVPSSSKVSTRSPMGKNSISCTVELWPPRRCRGPSGPHSVTERHSLQEASW